MLRWRQLPILIPRTHYYLLLFLFPNFIPLLQSLSFIFSLLIPPYGSQFITSFSILLIHPYFIQFSLSHSLKEFSHPFPFLPLPLLYSHSLSSFYFLEFITIQSHFLKVYYAFPLLSLRNFMNYKLQEIMVIQFIMIL